MNKTTKPIRAIGAKPEPPTQEQIEAQAKRAFLQKRNSLAEGILFNSLRHIGPETSSAIMRGIVDLAVEAADYLMEKLYSVAITEQKPEE